MRPEKPTAIVLCGGGGRRFGGIDKPLLRVGGRVLVELVVERLRPQVSRVVLSIGSRQDSGAWRDFGRDGFGCELVPDAEPNQGPLGGLATCLRRLAGDWFLTCPGDAPGIAPNLAAALAPDARARGIAVAHDGARRQNLFLLLRRDGAESLLRYYAGGGRTVWRWLDACGIPATDLSAQASSFVNINTAAELEAFRREQAASESASDEQAP